MGILQTGISALQSYQQGLTVTGHNIANVETEGYARQTVGFATQVPNKTGAGWIGNGVKVAEIRRQYDDFIAEQVRSSHSAASQTESYYAHAKTVDDLLADSTISLDAAMNDYFDALQALSNDPSSASARQQVMAESEALTDRFHAMDGAFDDARNLMNKEMDEAAAKINSLSSSIAAINHNIVSAIGAAGGAQPNDLLSQREVLLNELAQFADITVVPQDDGALNVFLGKGQALVMGASSSTITSAPATDDPSVRDILLTNQGSTQVITSELGAGQLGGVVAFRDEILIPAQNRLGLVAIGLANSVNAQHALGLDQDGNPGLDMFSMPTGMAGQNRANSGTGAVNIDLGDAGNLTNSNYELIALDGANQYRMVRLSDGVATDFDTGGASPYTTPEVDGFSLTIGGGAAQGDRFLIQPTRTAANSIDFVLTNPRDLAAASPLQAQPASDANGNPTNTGDAQIIQPVIGTTSGVPLAAGMQLQFSNDADGAGNSGFIISNGPAAPNNYLLYDPANPADIAGKSFPDSTNPAQFDAFGGLSFKISGTPSVGDGFVIGNNADAAGDNRNMLALANLQDLRGMLGGTASLHDVYSQMVSEVGTKTHHAEVNSAAQAALLQRNQEALDSVAGVNLDEEAANLVKYQQMYQAAAQIITAAGTMFDTLIAAVRR